MKPLVPQCLIGHKFVRVDEDKNYFLCCRSPIIGNYDTDGSFKEFWKSDKYNNLRKRLKYDLKGQNKEWGGVCFECPHYEQVKMLYEDGQIVDESPKLGPETFDIVIGNPCNHKCNFCWNWSYDMLENNAQRSDFKEWSKKHIDLETYVSMLNDLESLGGCEWISMSGGGEPFVVPNIMKMIQHTKNLGFKLKMFTNFSRVNSEDIDNFIEWGVDRFEINISAGTEETYCKSRKLKSKDWNLLLDNLRYMKSKKEELGKGLPRFKYVVVMTKENIEEVDEIFQLAVEYGSDFIDFRNMMGEVYNGEYLSPTENQIEKFNIKFIDNIKKYDFEVVEGEYYFYSEKFKLGVYNESFSSWG
tara:strand:+ start:1561 stop:2634 length:1074 start_codon:yes stop_codon:yes gene_type:complete